MPLTILAFSLTFIVIRALPSDPAKVIAGHSATPELLASIRRDLGLDKPLPVQYWHYLTSLSHGDLGTSFFTGNPVRDDLSRRLPATLELITIGGFFAFVFGLAVGSIVLIRPNGLADRLSRLHGLLAGAVPHFWLALLLIFVFFVQLGVAPAPIGRLGPGVKPPPTHTGFLTIDSLIAGNLRAFFSALVHLALPVLTLVLVESAAIAKMTRSKIEDVMRSAFIRHAYASGLPKRLVYRYVLRNALPPVVTLGGVVFGSLLAGALVVEKVFGWGGIGEYAVQAVAVSDLTAIQGFVILATVFSLTLFLILDIVHGLLDPRYR